MTSAPGSGILASLSAGLAAGTTMFGIPIAGIVTPWLRRTVP